MKCERCGGIMQEGQVSVGGGMIAVKNVSVLQCMNCGRREYGSTVRMKSAFRTN